MTTKDKFLTLTLEQQERLEYTFDILKEFDLTEPFFSLLNDKMVEVNKKYQIHDGEIDADRETMETILKKIYVTDIKIEIQEWIDKYREVHPDSTIFEQTIYKKTLEITKAYRLLGLIFPIGQATQKKYFIINYSTLQMKDFYKENKKRAK